MSTIPNTFVSTLKKMGLNKSVTTYAGSNVMTESTDSSYTMKGSEATLKFIQEALGEQNSSLVEGVLTYEFGEKKLDELVEAIEDDGTKTYFLHTKTVDTHPVNKGVPNISIMSHGPMSHKDATEMKTDKMSASKRHKEGRGGLTNYKHTHTISKKTPAEVSKKNPDLHLYHAKGGQDGDSYTSGKLNESIIEDLAKKSDPDDQVAGGKVHDTVTPAAKQTAEVGGKVFDPKSATAAEIEAYGKTLEKVAAKVPVNESTAFQRLHDKFHNHLNAHYPAQADQPGKQHDYRQIEKDHGSDAAEVIDKHIGDSAETLDKNRNEPSTKRFIDTMKKMASHKIHESEVLVNEAYDERSPIHKKVRDISKQLSKDYHTDHSVVYHGDGSAEIKSRDYNQPKEAGEKSKQALSAYGVASKFHKHFGASKPDTLRDAETTKSGAKVSSKEYTGSLNHLKGTTLTRISGDYKPMNESDGGQSIHDYHYKDIQLLHKTYHDHLAQKHGLDREETKHGDYDYPSHVINSVGEDISDHLHSSADHLYSHQNEPDEHAAIHAMQHVGVISKQGPNFEPHGFTKSAPPKGAHDYSTSHATSKPRSGNGAPPPTPRRIHESEDKKFSEGDSVKVTGEKIDGEGKTGHVSQVGEGGRFIVVKHPDGESASYHHSELSHHEDLNENFSAEHPIHKAAKTLSDKINKKYVSKHTVEYKPDGGVEIHSKDPTPEDHIQRKVVLTAVGTADKFHRKFGGRKFNGFVGSSFNTGDAGATIDSQRVDKDKTFEHQKGGSDHIISKVTGNYKPMNEELSLQEDDDLMSENLNENFNPEHPIHAAAKSIANGFSGTNNGGVRAIYHPDGSATLHTSTSATKQNHPSARLNNIVHSLGGDEGRRVFPTATVTRANIKTNSGIGANVELKHRAGETEEHTIHLTHVDKSKPINHDHLTENYYEPEDSEQDGSGNLENGSITEGSDEGDHYVHHVQSEMFHKMYGPFSKSHAQNVRERHADMNKGGSSKNTFRVTKKTPEEMSKKHPDYMIKHVKDDGRGSIVALVKDGEYYHPQSGAKLGYKPVNESNLTEGKFDVNNPLHLVANIIKAQYPTAVKDLKHLPDGSVGITIKEAAGSPAIDSVAAIYKSLGGIKPVDKGSLLKAKETGLKDSGAESAASKVVTIKPVAGADQLNGKTTEGLPASGSDSAASKVVDIPGIAGKTVLFNTDTNTGMNVGVTLDKDGEFVLTLKDLKAGKDKAVSLDTLGKKVGLDENTNLASVHAKQKAEQEKNARDEAGANKPIHESTEGYDEHHDAHKIAKAIVNHHANLKLNDGSPRVSAEYHQNGATVTFKNNKGDNEQAKSHEAASRLANDSEEHLGAAPDYHDHSDSVDQNGFKKLDSGLRTKIHHYHDESNMHIRSKVDYGSISPRFKK